MKKLYSIGETSKINSVSVQALRLYERMGLLKPAYINPKNGYRYYRDYQFIYIDIIKYSNYVKMPLKELSTLFKTKSFKEIKHLLNNREQQITDEIAYLTRVKNDIHSITKRLNDIDEDHLLKISNFTFNGCYVALKQVSPHDSYEILDKEMRNVEMSLFKSNVDYGSLSGVIYDSSFNSQYVFISLEKDNTNYFYIDEGNYLKITFKLDDLEEAKKILSTFLNKHNIHPNKIYLLQHITMSIYNLFDLMVKLEK